MTVVLTIIAAIVGFICLAGIGANDVANSQAMAVGSGAISLRSAQIIATIFEFLGAALVGHHVSNTVGEKVVDIGTVSAEKYAWGMLSAICSCGIWMIIATVVRMPVSSTHSIIGALIGFQLVISNGSFSSLPWGVLGGIGISWIATPFLSFALSIFLMALSDKLWPLYIMNGQPLSSPLLAVEMAQKEEEIQDGSPTLENQKSKKTFDMSKYFERPTQPQPFKFSIIFAILCSTLILFILAAGPKGIEILHKVEWWVFVIIGIGSLLVTMLVGYFIEPLYRKWYTSKYYTSDGGINGFEDKAHFNNMDYFSLYLIIGSATVSFAHGGNDVANVLGPFGQIFEYQKHGEVSSGAAIPIWMAIAGGLTIGFGFVLFGKGVLKTVGNDIAEITFQSGFIAQYSAALTVLICDVQGWPISSSTVIVGAVSGISFYDNRKEKSIRKAMGREKRLSMQYEYDSMGCCGKCLFRLKRMNVIVLLKIVGTWVITIPCNAGICAALYAIINAIWG